MASDARMGETPARWRRAPEAAQDSRGMESTGMLLSRSAAAELGLPGYQEPGKLSYGMEKGCPWRGSEGCLGPVRGCPYPPAPPCLRDALCRPKDGAELPPLLPPRNGQPKAGWGDPCKERPGPRWAEAVLAPLALYSHAYHRYPLPVPGLDTPRPGTAGRTRTAAEDTAGDPPAFRHCPFLVEAKHSPFLLSSLLPTGPPAEPPFGGAGTEGPGPMGDGRYPGPDWRLGSYAPAWGQPLYLGVPPRCKAALTPFDDCSSSGNKEFYGKKEPGFHSSTKNHAASQLLGKSQAGQDRDGEGEPALPELPGAPWRDGRAGGSSAVPAPHPRTPPPSASHPLLLLQRGSGGCGGPWVGARPHGADFSMDAAPGRPSEPKDERLGYQSAQPGSPPGCGEHNPSPLLADEHYPAALAKPEPPPSCLCPTPGCDGCPGVGCGVPNPFEPTLGMAGGRFPCPPSNHTKLKKTWLTRHSEQSLPRSKASRRDGGPEPPGEGKRSAKRPHGTADGPRGAGEGAGAAKRGTKATAPPGDGTGSAGDTEERRMELGDGEPPRRAGEPRSLQGLPCTALPPSIPRCCACAPRAGGDPEGEEDEEEPPENTCRLMHFRRFALGDNGELSVDGLCTLGEAEGELELGGRNVGSRNTGSRNVGSRNVGSRNVGSSLCLAKYLLQVLGDPFCDAVRRDRDTWPGAPGGPEGGPVMPPECTPGRDHHASSLVPTQFVPTCVLTRLWKLLHEVRVKFGIESHCPCGEGSLAEPPGRQEPPGAAVPTLPPRSHGPADPARPIKEESPEGRPPSPGQPPARGGAVQTTTLCDLLASTAVKLCLGQDGVRMAFAPVAPALPSDNRLTSILDSIIARVVEKKIQERQAGAELSPPSSLDPPASHCVLAPSGLLWLHDPGHASSYKLFQEHWRQGQPVLVSGLQKRLEGRLWAPESFQPSGEEEEEVEAVNLRAPRSRVRMSSRQFWDGFAASTASPEQEQSSGDLLKLESGFGDTELSRATNLRASLPLPEYCGASGRLNLATYLRGQRGRRWLRPRLRVAYGVRPQERNIGTKNLTVEAADSISVLAHAAPAAREVLLPEDTDELDAALRERLRDSGRPGVLWHIFRAEDAGRIRDFLRKASEEPGKDGEAAAEPPGRYLDPGLRRRLRDECGVSGWSLLQFPGDAVLVPAGAPHQVQSLSGTISVEQQFLSPESAVRLRHLGPEPAGTPRQLRAQLDGMIFAAVREALGVLRGCN
ncbi:lysine-specific demethylase hairless isoform X2 [Poecile atricapillus]|uniref:lysine-specific demethylase hairless isoform X2 n=1 Tax=Poecile atricapillus TaxID=48891 RepID=UPI00273A1EB0|nr:lysine-specific demethylase hairless isoform X2 [Poecile atricapillus]